MCHTKALLCCMYLYRIYVYIYMCITILLDVEPLNQFGNLVTLPPRSTHGPARVDVIERGRSGFRIVAPRAHDVCNG